MPETGVHDARNGRSRCSETTVHDGVKRAFTMPRNMHAVGLAGVADATSASMTAVDRYGFEIAAVTPKGPRATRLAFNEAITTSDDVRRSMVAMANRAREARHADR
jgi:hypothetical protein